MARRRLRPTEIREADSVFGSEVAYGAVWVHEGVRWPNWIAAVGAALTRQPRPKGMNSVTLGEHLYFPCRLHTEPVHLEAGLIGDLGWLMHEMTHVWQFRQGGTRTAFEAVWQQLRLGPAVYDYGGQTGLEAASARHASLADFNPEQQGDIVRDYYLRKKMGLATRAWEPFIAELHAAHGA